MNKTVNINLGGMIFHIDENAYQKLQNYLNAVKRSFAGASGEDEIISDIENRIAELFSQKMQHDRQVISNKEVEEVIEVMGQPEDYMVDEDIFEDEPRQHSSSTSSTHRKLYRDIDNKYISGVSAGLAHYIGIDALWIRLLWIILFFGFGTGILIYLLLWILIPKAETTAQKIAMTGDPVNISNIEKKIKEGIDNATETVKNVDYQKYGNKAQSGISKFFDSLGDIFMTLFKVFGKFIGVILILVGVTTLISLVIGLITAGSIDIFGFEFSDQLALYDYASAYPFWLIALLALFAIGIPFFFIAYLGLKILVNNSKSIGNIAKFSLLGVWLLALIGLIIFGVRSGLRTKEEASVIIKEELMITPEDTLNIRMVANELYTNSMYKRANERFEYDENDQKHIFAQDIRLIVKSTKDSIATLKIKKEARGISHLEARDRARDITYEYSLENNTLSLNNYFLASPDQKYNNQEVELTLYLPEGTVIKAHDNTYYYHRNTEHYGDILDNGTEGQYLRILDGETECLDCDSKSFSIEEDDSEKVIIDGNGIRIIDSDGEKVIIDRNGLDINVEEEGEQIKMKIDEDGIKIKKEKIEDNDTNTEND